MTVMKNDILGNYTTLLRMTTTLVYQQLGACPVRNYTASMITSHV